jgi:hypothetical protein
MSAPDARSGPWPHDRRHPRLSTTLSGGWSDGSRISHAEVGNLSLGGCCLRALVSAPTRGQAIFILLSVPGQFLHLRAVVKWIRAGQSFGAAFVDVPSHTIDALARYLNAEAQHGARSSP